MALFDFLNIKQDPAAAKGYAQVFDTTSIYKNYLAMQEKKKKDFKESLVNVDVSKLYHRDVDMFNSEHWNPYLKFVKENYKALKNPRKNIDIHLQKRRMEQEMLQFAHSSSKAQNYEKEINRYRANNQMEEQYNEEGRGLYSSWLNDAGNFTDPFTLMQKVHKDINSQQQALYRSLKASTIEKSTLETPIDPNNPSKGSTTTTTSKVDMVQWDNGIENHYNTNLQYSKQVDANFERAKENAGGELYLPFTYFNEDENKEVTEDVLIESGLQYEVVTARAHIPKGSEKLTYTNPSKFNFSVNIGDRKTKKWDAGGPDVHKTGNFAINNKKTTVTPMTYGEGTNPLMRMSSVFQGNVKSNLGREYSGEQLSGTQFYGFGKTDDGDLVYYLTRPSKEVEGKISEKKKELAKANERGLVYDDTKEEFIPNPDIPKLEAEIAKLEKVKGTGETITVPLYDANGNVINMSMLQVNGIAQTIEEARQLAGVTGGTSKKKKFN